MKKMIKETLENFDYSNVPGYEHLMKPCPVCGAKQGKQCVDKRYGKLDPLIVHGARE